MTLARVCIVQENVIIPKGGVKIKPPETRVSTNKNGNRTSVNIGETIVFKDVVYVTVGVSEIVSCQKVIEIFKKLQSLNRFDKRKARPLKLSNFTKALKEYEDAMINGSSVKIQTSFQCP